MSSYDTMGLLAFAIVIGLVSVATILINIFFICCMFSSQEGPENQQKPPLNVLLGSLIGCNLILSICIIIFLQQGDMPFWVYYYVLSVAALYALRTSFTASLGLNVFYYFQIVPARHPFLIWVKTHIKLFIYLMLFFGNIFILSGLILFYMPLEIEPSASLNSSSASFNSSSASSNSSSASLNSSSASLNSSSASLNSSSASLNSSSASLNTKFNYRLIFRLWCILSITGFCLRCVYFLVGFGIMVASNTSTVLYLRRHVRRMEDSSSFSALHYQKQKRVTTLSIIQTVLFFIYSVGLVIYEFNVFLPVFHPDIFYIYFAILAFYCFGTTIIIGVGQTKFRVCAVDIWKKIGQTISGSNPNVGDRNGHFNCCLNFCYNNTENGEMLTIAHI